MPMAIGKVKNKNINNNKRRKGVSRKSTKKKKKRREKNVNGAVEEWS